MQIGNKVHQVVVDCFTIPVEEYREVLTDPTKTYLFQNALYDLKFFLKYNITIKNIVDTMLNEAVLTTGIEERTLSLDVLAWTYCQVRLDKTIRGKINNLGLVEDELS